MSKKVVIFGIGKIAEVVAHVAMEQCNIDVAAFAVDKEYIDKHEFLGKPVVSFEDIETAYPPASYAFFVGVGYHKLNKLREQKCKEAELKGYELINVVSSYAHLSSSVKVGKNCFIMAPCLIHPAVTIKDNVFVWNGAIIGHHSVIESNVWLTSACNISGNVTIGANTFVAVNATIGHSVRIGANCFVGANTLIVKDLEDEKVVIVEASKPIRLTSEQFLKVSSFSSL